MSEPSTTYQDDDLVYVNPDTRTVVGRVEWTEDGRPKALEMGGGPVVVEDEEPVKDEKPDAKKKGKGRPPRKIRKRYYPWGTYGSLKKVYRLEGKEKGKENQITLDVAIEKAMKEPYWD